MRTLQAPSECGWAGGSGCSPAEALPPDLPRPPWLAADCGPGPFRPHAHRHGAPQGRPSPASGRVGEGRELGLLFCFLLRGKLLPVSSALTNPLSALSVTLLSCLSRFLFFNFLH